MIKTAFGSSRIKDFIGFWDQFKKNRAAVLGVIIIGFMVLIAVFVPWIAPYDPFEMQIGREYRLLKPSS